MKIFIAGSMHFAKEMLEAQKLLNGLGFESMIPADTHECVDRPELNMDAEHCFNTDIMRSCMEMQEKCNAILVLNYPRDGIDGYIGASSLMELYLAYYLKQKIFLLHTPPPKDIARSSHEVMHMKPIILNGDISRIKEHV
ncbi:MAG: hypothetical protein ISS93_01820 [Candidatus Aenigmarchaeota archaeon]|nr:hypothetical protein [Candidatus Aenigmarchaeota archaeon]